MEPVFMSNQKRVVSVLFSAAIIAGIFPIAAVEVEKSADNEMINGLNPQTLNTLADRLKKDPKAGQATFYSDTKWTTGMKSITSFTKYKIDGEVKGANTRKFVLQGDEMSEISGTDTMPGAIEEMMYAVGTCIVAAANANAAVMGVKLSKIDVALESDIDMHGLMGVSSDVRPGVLDFRTIITIGGDADEATLKKIAMKGYSFSPVSDTVRHGTTKAPPPVIIIEK
jgi:uncharacterized OsmC-like protein